MVPLFSTRLKTEHAALSRDIFRGDRLSPADTCSSLHLFLLQIQTPGKIWGVVLGERQHAGAEPWLRREGRDESTAVEPRQPPCSPTEDSGPEHYSMQRLPRKENEVR